MDYITVWENQIFKKLLWHHENNLSFTASGYGGKIPSENMLKYNGKNYRIYSCIFGNSGYNYIICKKKELILQVA